MKSYYVYILTNHTNSVLYIGISNNLERRMIEHIQGQNKDSFSVRYHLYKLVWYQEFSDPKEAILVEKKIKGWKREKKFTLIKSMNPEMKNMTR